MPRNMKQRAITEKHKAPWCTWPWREYARNLQDLATAGAICDAWRAFFSSQTVQALSALRGYVCWFNRYEAFDRLIMEFACSQRRLEDTLRFLMLPGKQTPIVFTRVDIYDKRAWCTLPLDHFAPVSGLGPRTLDPFWQQEALSLAHTPLVAFGIPMHWTVPSSCFSVR